jgi:tellurite resistance protein TerC
VLFYAALALAFGGIIWAIYGHIPASEFYSGWLTEYSLSIDNLFVFVLILTNFAVPKKLQKYALGVGIIIALVFRAVFIFIGAAVIEQFSWVFYFFGAFLIYTAINLLISQDSEEEYQDGFIVRRLRKVLKTSTKYNDTKLRVKDPKTGTMLWTPLLIVFISLGATDLFFAFDSIPAIFGLTKDPFIVLSANIFALMGLQQLYFLLGSLVKKLKYLPLGLAIVLAFIGVKLIFEALHSSGIEWAPEIETLPSLMVILITVSFTAAASVLKIRRDARRELLKAEIKAEVLASIQAEINDKKKAK